MTPALRSVPNPLRTAANIPLFPIVQLDDQMVKAAYRSMTS